MIMIMIVSKLLSNSTSGSGKAIHTKYIYLWIEDRIFLKIFFIDDKSVIHHVS